jgi:hypothetical protein
MKLFFLITTKQQAIQKYICFIFASFQKADHLQIINPSSTFWIDGHEIGGGPVLELDQENNLWVRENIWRNVSSMCAADYDEVQKGIRACVKNLW